MTVTTELFMLNVLLCVDRSICLHAGLEIRGSNGSKCYHFFSFATGILMW